MSHIARSESRTVNIPLAGLTIKETNEFKAIEKLLPIDCDGTIAWTFEGEPTTEREKRWLELYEKHNAAGANQKNP
jgi:hypothetical protein